MNFLQYIKQLIRSYRYFLVPYLVLIIFCGIILCICSKPEIHIWINRHNAPFLDFFFSKITFFGNGIFVIGLCVLLMFFRFRHTLLLFSTFIISGMLVQIIKRFVLPGMPRPNIYFKDLYDLHYVKGVEMLHSFSFPSGHTATAFTLCLSLAIITKNNLWRFLLFFTACLIGYSRIYLSQHFLVDTVAGSFIGVLVTLVYYYFHLKMKGEWLEKSVLSLMKKQN
jgi:membrane-associated phospholipid phosphatase